MTTVEVEAGATEGVTVMVEVLVEVEWMVLVRVVVDSMGTRVGEP
jgi:threonine/homoserine efflux transporter RhtA